MTITHFSATHRAVGSCNSVARQEPCLKHNLILFAMKLILLVKRTLKADQHPILGGVGAE